MIQPNGKIYYAISSYDLMLLIPKKRGAGFLRQPVGHHGNDLSQFINRTFEIHNYCGLDGYLNLEMGYTFQRTEEITEIAKQIADFLKREMEEVTPTELLNYVLAHP